MAQVDDSAPDEKGANDEVANINQPPFAEASAFLQQMTVSGEQPDSTKAEQQESSGPNGADGGPISVHEDPSADLSNQKTRSAEFPESSLEEIPADEAKQSADGTGALASIPRNEIWRRTVEGTVEGNGEITFPDGTSYNGEWLAKEESKTQRTIIRHGRGFHMFADGSWYEGEWDYDRQHGEGEAEFPDGTLFRGRWDFGLMGSGVLSTPEGHSYTGTFEDNKMNGKGDMQYANGAIYQGFWVGGKKHGSGHYTYSNGNTYDGKWIQDFCNGPGKYTSVKGWSYEGEFELGKRHGEGKLTYKDGTEYIGTFSHGSRHGKGKLTTGDGGYYAGEWVHDRKHGHGTFRWKDSQGSGEDAFFTYAGEFSRGLRSGWGKLEYPTGETFEGEWLNNLRHGQGVMHAHAFTYDGTFHLDKRQGTGTLCSVGDFTYVGDFDNGLQHGEAKLVTTRGFFGGRPHGPAMIEQEIRPGLHALCRCEYNQGRRVGVAKVEGDKKSFTMQYDEDGTLLSVRIRPQTKTEEKELIRTYGRAFTNHRMEFRQIQEAVHSARSDYKALSADKHGTAAGERFLGASEESESGVQSSGREDPNTAGEAPGRSGSGREDGPQEEGGRKRLEAGSEREVAASERESLVLQTSLQAARAGFDPSQKASANAAVLAGLQLPEDGADADAGLREDEVVAWLGARAEGDPVSRSGSSMAVEAPAMAMPQTHDRGVEKGEE